MCVCVCVCVAGEGVYEYVLDTSRAVIRRRLIALRVYTECVYTYVFKELGAALRE